MEDGLSGARSTDDPPSSILHPPSSIIHPPSSPCIPVGIAVVEQGGRYLVGKRRKDQCLPGLAEFPGGRCRNGESAEQCAVRECLEETGLLVRPVGLLENRQFQYEHASVDLHQIDAVLDAHAFGRGGQHGGQREQQGEH